MQDKIGLLLAKGLSVAYKEKPKNPVDFFAKWLLLQSDISKKEAREEAENKRIDIMLEKKEVLDNITKKADEETKLEE